ncbi:M56 family metallopeptidase [Kaistella sp.]|uniref:M56 family metallopeptidase n=1 Tax=Kaistella sp. TaxID=2782235 RepID=UPI00359F5F71
METLFFYFGKVIFTSGVMFLYYKLFLKDKTFHHYNRFYLLATVLISLLLPLLKVRYFTLEVNSDIYLLINRLQNLSSTNNLNDDFNYFKTGAVLTGLVAIFFLTKLIFGLVKIQLFKKKFSKENFEGISFYQTDLAEAPFSFFKNLFWKNSIAIQSDLGRQILKHEMVHIEQKHSWDKIFLEITTSLFWFNPFFYLIKKEIHLIHEYLADKKAIKNSDTKAFAQMLLASHFSGKQLPATSPFLSSNLKKRLTMLKKSKTKFSYARRILALPLLFILSFIYLINAKNKEITNTNLEIKNAVSQLKSDTIKTNKKINSITQNDIAVGTDGTKLNQDHPQLFIDNDKIIEHDVSESPEFKQRIAEAQKSAAEADRLVNSPAFKKRIKDAEKKALEADRLFNSPAFKKRIEDAERKAAETDRIVNSPEFKKKIEEAEKKAAEADRLFNSPAFKKRIEEAEKKAAEGEKLVYSIKFSSDIKNAEKKATEAVRKLKYEFKQNTEGAEIIAVEPTTYQPNSGIKFSDDVDIFIDEKPATREEMQILDPKKIESVHVYKKESSGNKRGQIYIKLKK